MQIDERTGGAVVLTYASTRIAGLFVVLGSVAAAALVVALLRGESDADRITGLLVGAAAFLFTAIVVFERAVVIVDPDAGTIAWSRTWGFRRHDGTLRCDEIAAVLAERPVGDEGVPSRRLVLQTKDGRTMPLMMSYRQDGDGRIARAAEAIREALRRGGSRC